MKFKDKVVFITGGTKGLGKAMAKTNFLCSRKWCDFWKRCEEEFGGTVRG